MKFGNLITYTGKYLSKATAKAIAESGNLVFAHITGSKELAEDHADYDKDGYYIYAGGAEALLVTKDDFVALKGEVKDLQTKVGDLKIGDNSYANIVAYVDARIEALQLGDASKKGVATGVTADEAGLTTGAQVYTHVSGAVAALEESISGVKGDLDDYVLKTSVKNSFDGAADGDVASVGAVKTHVSGAIAALQLGDASKKGVAETVTKESVDLPTASAVATYVDTEISKLGTVMSFIGVIELAEGTEFDTTNKKVTINSKEVTAENGDVVIVGSKEYVWDGASWKEFGDASAEAAAITALRTDVNANSGAIATLSATLGEIAGENAIGFADNKITLKIAEGDAAGNVTLTQDTNGLKADVVLPTAETLAYAGETLEGETKPTTDATNVKGALDDLFKSDKVASAAINDLNERLDEISGVVDAVEHTTVSDGDTTDFVAITETTAGAHKNYAVSATVVKGTSGDTGLATDAYVKEVVETALTWEVLTDAAE